jgi:hypothetical protein
MYQIFLGSTTYQNGKKPVPNDKKYTKWLKIFTNGLKMYQHYPFQGPPKYTQIGILGMKLQRLATLVPSHFDLVRGSRKVSFYFIRGRKRKMRNKKK